MRYAKSSKMNLANTLTSDLYSCHSSKQHAFCALTLLAILFKFDTYRYAGFSNGCVLVIVIVSYCYC
jgi:hypothetical protein